MAGWPHGESLVSCVKHPRLVLYINRQFVVNFPKKTEKKTKKTLWLWLRPTDSHLKKKGLCLAQDDQCSTVQPLGFPEKSGQDDPWTIDGCTRPVDKRQASRNQSRPEQSPGQSRRNQSRISSRCGCDFGVLKHGKVTNK